MSREPYASMRARAEAKMEVLKLIVPQIASGPKILSEDAEDSGDIDSWMLTNMNSDIFLGLTGLRMIAKADDADYIEDFIHVFLRGLKGINAFTVKQLERIAIGLGGGGTKKVMKRPGWGGRNITNRDYQRKADAEGVEITE